MKKVTIHQSNSFTLVCDDIASDKSISHRCAIFSLLSDKPSKVRNFLPAEDTLNTLSIVQSLGATVEKNGDEIVITPPQKITEPSDLLDCGNSGTAMRLMCGFLASCDGLFILSGDEYLKRRPMQRVAKPLNDIGAKIDGRANGNLAPLVIRGGSMDAFDYQSTIASAQVKSALILAALRAKSRCTFREPELSRDHTERMLQGMGCDLEVSKDGTITINPLQKPLEPLDITVPSDPSSGFFFAVAAAITPQASIVIKNVSLNKTRVEAYRVLQKMGADVEFIQKENIYEPIGDIKIAHNTLKAVSVEENISWLIDELPALSIAFAMAEGTSCVKNAQELRVKESDRIKSVVDNLNLCGIQTAEYEDGYEVMGGKFQKATINSYGDHRIAMSFSIAGTICGMDIEDTQCVDTSFPNFYTILSKITKVEIGS
jgi:3-phosphoshikimate 1-carboxyvinyltransferase